MVSTHVDIEQAEWTSATPFYGPTAIYQGKEIVQLKILSDRRQEGGGIAWLAKFSPPPGKLIKIVATALSDEHVFNLEGGKVTKGGQPARSSGAELVVVPTFGGGLQQTQILRCPKVIESAKLG